MGRGADKNRLGLEARISIIILNLADSKVLSYDVIDQLTKGSYAMAACAAILDASSALRTRYNYRTLIRKYIVSRGEHSQA